MRGLLPFYRGLYTLSNRQASRKAGIVGSRCGLCGTQSNSKVRFELLLLLRALANNMSLTLITRRYFVVLSHCFFFVTMYRIDVACGVARNFLSCGCAQGWNNRGADIRGSSRCSSLYFCPPPPTMRKTTTDTLCSFFVLISPSSRGGKNFEVWDTVRLIVIC